MLEAAIKYYAMPPQADKAVTVGLEKLHDIWSEILPLYKTHYAETETEYRSERCDPDKERYLLLEDEGSFVVFTARRKSDRALIGYLQFFVFRDIHSRLSLIAKEDAFYLLKEARGTGIAKAMLSYAEEVLSVMGCESIGMSSKAPMGGSDLGPFLKRKGYSEIAVFYSKNLEEANVRK